MSVNVKLMPELYGPYDANERKRQVVYVKDMCTICRMLQATSELY